MRFFISLVTLLFSVGAFAEAPTQINIAFGLSVPADPSGQTFVEKAGPSRASGGEHIIVKFARAKTVSDIKLTGYSSGHAGKTLMHSAIGTNGTTKTSLDALVQFKKVTTGNPDNYNNLVMLSDTKFVETTPNLAFTQIEFVVEGYTNNDASLLLQVSSNDGLSIEDFMITRTGSNETVGGLIDESKYAKFGAAELQALISRGTIPDPSAFDGKTFKCTNYTRLYPAQVDVKARAYAVSNGALVSTSSLQGPTRAWNPTAEGWSSPVTFVSGCGQFNSYDIVRMTAAGNLVSEVVIDLEAYVAQCEQAGYKRQPILDIEANETFPSVINSRYVVNSFEYCHQ